MGFEWVRVYNIHTYIHTYLYIHIYTYLYIHKYIHRGSVRIVLRGYRNGMH